MRDFLFPYQPPKAGPVAPNAKKTAKTDKPRQAMPAPTLLKQQFTRHLRAIAALTKDKQWEEELLLKAVGTLTVLWSVRQAPKLPCAGFDYSTSMSQLPEIRRFVDWLCQQDFLHGAYWLSSAYSIWVGADYRKQLAMFFTPPSLTKRLLDDLEQAGASFGSHSFFDPACGGAAFLAPIAQRMQAALQAQRKTAGEIIRHVERYLFGTDMDPMLCQMSNQFLRIVLADEIALSGIEPKFHVAKANSLSDISNLYATLDVIVCNPPYRKMPAAEVAHYRKEYDSVIDAQPNLYGLFLALGLKLLRPSGMAGFVTPTSFMSGRYFCKLRTHLIENAHIANIGIVSDREGVFIDVEQETALTILKRHAPKQMMQTSAKVSVVSKQGDFTSVGSCLIPSGGSAWPIPRAEGDAELIRIMGTSRYRLADYGFAPRIGVFVWNRDTRQTYYQMSDARAAKAKAPYPLLWSSDITTTGEVLFGHSKKAIQEPSIIDVVEEKSSAVIRRPSILLQRVTSNDQPLRLVAGVVPNNLLRRYGGFVGENHVVVLESMQSIPQVPLELMAKLLGSGPIDRYFRCISGATNVSIFELQQLPLPEPSRLRALLKKGVSFDDAVVKAYKYR